MDNLIGYFAPTFQKRRLLSRLDTKRIQTATRRYEAATKSPRTSNVRAGSSSANKEIGESVHLVRDRIRQLVRDNSYAARAVTQISTNIVGKGISANIRVEGNEDKERLIEREWRKWALDCRNFDFDCRHNFYGMQRLVSRAVPESGESIARLRRQSNGKPQVQLLESDFLFSEKLQESTKNRVVDGVEVDSSGRVVAYHLYKEHPGSSYKERKSFDVRDSVRVPRDQIAFIYKQDRPGQLRAVSWLAPAYLRMLDLDQYDDAQLKRQQVAACYAIFEIDTTDPSGGAFQAPKDGDEDDDEEGAVYPGMIKKLGAGQDIRATQPPGPGEDYKDYHTTQARWIAAPLGLPYEEFAGDLREVNFSSLRMGRLSFNRNIDEWQQYMMIPMFCTPVFQWFLDYLVVSGVIKDKTDVRVDWEVPKRELTDPTKEIPAMVQAARAGIENVSDQLRQLGKHPDDHFNQRKRDDETLDSLGLVLDSDPRVTTQQGIFQVVQEGEQLNETDNT